MHDDMDRVPRPLENYLQRAQFNILDGEAEDEADFAAAVQAAVGAPPFEPLCLDFAQFDAMLDRHSAYAKGPFERGVPAVGGGGRTALRLAIPSAGHGCRGHGCRGA